MVLEGESAVQQLIDDVGHTQFGIAQGMAELPLFSGIEYRTLCWGMLMVVTIVFVLWYANRVRRRKQVLNTATGPQNEPGVIETQKAGLSAWITFAAVMIVLVLFSVFYASSCIITLGQSSFNAPWLLWTASAFFAVFFHQ